MKKRTECFRRQRDESDRMYVLIGAIDVHMEKRLSFLEKLDFLSLLDLWSMIRLFQAFFQKS